MPKPEESPVPKPKQVRAPTPQAVPAPPPSASAPTHAELPSGDPGFARAAGLLADAHRQTDSAPAAAESRAESGTRPQSAAPQREPLTAAPPQPIAPARDRIASVLAKLRVPNLAWSRAGAILLAAFVVAFAGTLLWMNQRRMETPDPAPLLEEAALPVPPPEPAPAPAAPPAAIVAEPVAVHINATPWATIRIDGVESGVTPLAGVNLSPGVHVFEALFPDGRAIERQVDISATNRFVAFE